MRPINGGVSTLDKTTSGISTVLGQTFGAERTVTVTHE